MSCLAAVLALLGTMADADLAARLLAVAPGAGHWPGAGVDMEGGTVTISNSQIEFNTAQGGNGAEAATLNLAGTGGVRRVAASMWEAAQSTYLPISSRGIRPVADLRRAGAALTHMTRRAEGSSIASRFGFRVAEFARIQSG